ncbi:MAG TPA: histidinol-phosphate transaminase, partial [Balneola sp.]|nr:histidinol-phosphate transaminase [Balneola sp.]
MSENQKKPLVPKNIEQLNRYIAGKTIAEVKEAYNPERISKLASNENRLG